MRLLVLRNPLRKPRLRGTLSEHVVRRTITRQRRGSAPPGRWLRLAAPRCRSKPAQESCAVGVQCPGLMAVRLTTCCASWASAALRIHWLRPNRSRTNMAHVTQLTSGHGLGSRIKDLNTFFKVLHSGGAADSAQKCFLCSPFYVKGVSLGYVGRIQTFRT